MSKPTASMQAQELWRRWDNDEEQRASFGGKIRELFDAIKELEQRPDMTVAELERERTIWKQTVDGLTTRIRELGKEQAK